MTFLYQALTWGFLLALLPLLIHLINMMRHRRVRWAAMDFLLQSYKKHRKWVWLKQLLLLLMRMAVIALIVGMLAQWLTQGEWLDIFGGKETHHYVLLDASYSMSERFGGSSVFDRAMRVVQQIGGEASGERSAGQHKFTLLRFSQASTVSTAEASAGELQQLADLNAEIVDKNFELVLEEKRTAVDVSELAVGPGPALEVAKQLIGQRPDENRVLYVVSDFRTKEWGNPSELKASLRDLNKGGT